MSFFLCCLGFTQILAQDQRNYAELIQKNFETYGSVEITYRVPTGYTYAISLETGDADYVVKNARGLGEQAGSGSGYMSLVWYFSEDGFNQTQIEPLKLRVVALRIGSIDDTGPVSPSRPLTEPRPSSGKGMSIAGIGLIGVGAAAGVYGYVLYGQTMDLYEVYEMNLNPNEEPYTRSFDRDAHYTQANETYRQAQMLWYAGGGLALIGGVLMVASKRKNANASLIQLQPWENLAEVQIPEKPVGMGMKIRF